MSEYEFCPIINNQVCCQDGYPFSMQGIMLGPLPESDCSSCICILLKIAYDKKITEYDQEIPQPHTLIIIFVIYLISVYYIEP